MANVKKIPHPDFARRMAQACDGNPDVPPPNYGRLGWFVNQLNERFHVEITQETVRKWFAGESRPRPRLLSNLAQVLRVDEAWLSVGKTPEISEKQQRARDASADGAVNVVAGFIQMCGGHPAFPRDDDERASKQKIDLYAIIRGAQYAFHVVTGHREDGKWDVAIPLEARETIVIAVLPIGALNCEFVELDWESITQQGKRKGGAYEVSVDFDFSNGVGRKIETFADRL